LPFDAFDLGDAAPLLTLMASGLTDGAIARKLGISERTVRRRVSDILAELGVATRFQAGLLLSSALNSSGFSDSFGRSATNLDA
jgi:hypothetical protein